MTQEPKLQQLYNYPGLSVEKTKHKQHEEAQLNLPKMVCKDPSALVGIEIEVENMGKPVNLQQLYWKNKQDNSLRNYGCEFVSIPLRGSQIEYALTHLQKCIQESDNVPDYSPRTSIHIHLNVRDMTWSQVRVLLLLYALFERHFFKIAGTKREQSIYCVPLYKSNQLQAYNHLEYGTHKWHKYNAINLGTILGNEDVSMYGTIEFRHMYGTDDIEYIMYWINNILMLRKASTKYDLANLLERIMDMNTSSEYHALYSNVFLEYAQDRGMTKKDFEYCISGIKENLWGFKCVQDNLPDYVTSALCKAKQRIIKQQEDKEMVAFTKLKENVGTTQKNALLKHPFKTLNVLDGF